MIHLDIPQRGSVDLQHAVFDVNGTLAVDGFVIPEAASRLRILGRYLFIHVLTAGTQGDLAQIEHELGFSIQLMESGEQKRCYVEQLGAAHVIAFGNGETDAGMLQAAAIGVAVLTEEGVAIRALQSADVLVQGPVHAIDLLLKPKRLIATLRR